MNFSTEMNGTMNNNWTKLGNFDQLNIADYALTLEPDGRMKKEGVYRPRDNSFLAINSNESFYSHRDISRIPCNFHSTSYLQCIHFSSPFMVFCIRLGKLRKLNTI